MNPFVDSPVIVKQGKNPQTSDTIMENYHCKPTPPIVGQKNIAVIVGRFQSDTVCYALDSFIRGLQYENKVVLLVGLSPIKATKENPLDFEARKLMLMEAYPQAEIGYIQDNRDDAVWSENLDEQVNRLKKKYKAEKVKLYGGTETFLNSYSGDFSTGEIPMEKYVNEKMERQKIKSSVKGTADFRRGVIWAVENQFPKVYPTVDAIIFKDENHIVLGRKPGEDKLRFIGGFIDPRETAEDAAVREAKEETGLDVKIRKYFGTHVVNDWRYQGIDNIMTTAFICDIVGGTFTPGDDIEELRIVELNALDESELVSEHRNLFRALYEEFNTDETYQQLGYTR
jgi:bifunctional NMN adenylyltransferase/nudix hydrolase